MSSLRRPLAAVLALLALTLGLTACLTEEEVDAACGAMSSNVYHRVKPTTGASLFTRSLDEATNAEINHGFTEDRGVPFTASVGPVKGLIAIHRWYGSSNGDFLWQRVDAPAPAGYVEQGANFYAATQELRCTAPVHQFTKGTKHRLAASEADRQALAATGWTDQGIAFHAVPGPDAPVDTRFTIAMIPDTQTETTNPNDTRFRQRTQWLVDERHDLDLRFVGHIGDVTNWGWLVPSQRAIAADAFVPIEQAGIPYAAAIGNHDTRAVGHDGVPGSRGYGGAAYVGNPECVERFSVAECKTNLLVRHTEEFNDTFSADRYGNVGGAFEAGKVDNIWSSFDAGGSRWLVLTLELWPRDSAIQWAKGVVASHPDHNVIIQTHSYLNWNGSISTSNGGYGSTAPSYLYEQLVEPYPNVRLVFSGHTGLAASRTDTGANGNTVVSFLQAFHATTNPVRLVEIDTATDTLTTRIYVPSTGEYLTQYDQTFTGLDFVDP